jgi:hypothetical protein
VISGVAPLREGKVDTQFFPLIWMNFPVIPDYGHPHFYESASTRRKKRKHRT